MASLVECSQYAMVGTYKKWCKEGQLVNWHQSHGCPRLIEEQRLACLVWSHRIAPVAQNAEKCNAGHDGRASKHTQWMLLMGLCSCRPVRVPIMTPVHHQKHLQWGRGHPYWTTEQREKVAWSDGSHFLLQQVDGQGYVSHLPGGELAAGCTMGGRLAGRSSVALWPVFC